MSSVVEILLVALRLGLTSFGGPIAHIGYFRNEYVERRGWLSESRFADLIALCYFLPGPASSQLGIAVGIIRGGILGGFAAWLGFTLPSAVALILFAYGVTEFDELFAGDWLKGLKIVAAAVVAYALWGMGRSLAPDRMRATIAVVSTAVLLLWEGSFAFAFVMVMAVAGVVGWRFLRQDGDGTQSEGDATPVRINRFLAIGSLGLFFLLLVGLPLVRQLFDSLWLDVFDGFFRSGSLIFGGGHVVLPLLHAEVVPTGLLTDDEVIAGYGAAQAVPGPLFTFSAYLGGIIDGFPAKWIGGLFALCAVFLPSFLLVIGILPFWSALSAKAGVRAALAGINAAVVGFVADVLYDPIWITTILSPADFAMGMVAFGLLVFWRCPPWLVVLVGAVAGMGLSLI